jgi:hypothetical protein
MKPDSVKRVTNRSCHVQEIRHHHYQRLCPAMALSGPSILVDGSSIKTERPAAHPSVLSDYVPGSVADASAHNWNSSIVGNTLQTSGRWLVDGWGRVCLPRGVNLAAASKLSDHIVRSAVGPASLSPIPQANEP